MLALAWMSLLNNIACHCYLSLLDLFYGDKWPRCLFPTLSTYEFGPYFMQTFFFREIENSCPFFPSIIWATINKRFIHHSLFSTIISLVSFSTYLSFTHTSHHITSHHITSHQTNSYMKIHKHENIRIFEKRAPWKLI